MFDYPSTIFFVNDIYTGYFEEDRRFSFADQVKLEFLKSLIDAQFFELLSTFPSDYIQVSVLKLQPSSKEPSNKRKRCDDQDTTFSSTKMLEEKLKELVILAELSESCSEILSAYAEECKLAEASSSKNSLR
jgi:hypothetical protein